MNQDTRKRLFCGIVPIIQNNLWLSDFGKVPIMNEQFIRHNPHRIFSWLPSNVDKHPHITLQALDCGFEVEVAKRFNFR
jgi:hypothetical protein